MTTQTCTVREIFASSRSIIETVTTKKARERFAPSPGRVMELAWGYFADRLPPHDTAPEPQKEWFRKLLALFAPAADHLDQLPAKAAFVFGFDPDAARANKENAAALAADSARMVLAEFADRVRAHAGPVTPEIFEAWMNEIKAATGVKGKELFYPVRIALTGAHSGPDFDTLLPLIEEGAELGLGIPSVCERIERFVGV